MTENGAKTYFMSASEVNADGVQNHRDRKTGYRLYKMDGDSSPVEALNYGVELFAELWDVADYRVHVEQFNRVD